MKFIYKISNLVDGKIYIGKTIKPIESRFKAHVSEMERFKKCLIDNIDFGYNSRLYPAMLKYGVENFIIELVEEVPSDVNLEEREIYYIKKFNSCDPSIGYNISPGGLGGPLFLGHHHTDKTKKLISAKSKGKKQSKEFIEKRTSGLAHIYQNLTTGEVFSNIKEASKRYGGAIRYAAKNGGTANGYFWKDLSAEQREPYSIEECKLLCEEYTKKLHNIYSIGSKKGWSNKTEETKKAAIEKGKITAETTRKNRSEEAKAIISKNISNALKGRKHSPETLIKLKEYYNKASEDELKIRRLHISEGQKGKKRYKNKITGKHKMFKPDDVNLELWELLDDRKTN